jgi:type IV pilus assembly protein PilB
LIHEADLDPRLIALIPPETARQANAIPIAMQKGNLVVATSDPHNARALREIEAATGHSVEAWLAGDPAVASALDRYYPRADASTPWLASGTDGLPPLDAGRQRSIEALIDGWIAEAVACGEQVLVIQMTPGGLEVRGEGTEGGCELARPHASVFPEVMTRLRARSSLRSTSGPARREAGALPYQYQGERLRLGIMLVPDVYGSSARVSLVEAHNRRLERSASSGNEERDRLAS